jgi:hypothetical protein
MGATYPVMVAYVVGQPVLGISRPAATTGIRVPTTSTLSAIPISARVSVPRHHERLRRGLLGIPFTVAGSEVRGRLLG